MKDLPVHSSWDAGERRALSAGGSREQCRGSGRPWGRESPGPWKTSTGTPARGAAWTPPASRGAGRGSRNQLGLRDFTGHHLNCHCSFSLERRQEILFHREELFPYEPYQQIHVLKVLGIAKVNFTTCYNMVVHHPSLISDFGKLNIKLVDLVLIGAVINTENFH